MPVNAAYVTGWGSAGAGAVTVNCAAQNLTKNTLYLVETSVRGASSANLSNVTISSPHLTWVRVGAPQDVGTSAPTRRIELWWAMPTSNLAAEVIAMAIANGLSQTEYGAELFTVSGCDPTTPVTSNVIQGDSGTTSGTTFAIPATFAAFGSIDNGAFAVFGTSGGSTSSTMSPRSGWAELREFGDANEHHQAQWTPGNDTTASVTNSSSGLHAGIAVELKAASAPVVISNTSVGNTSGGTQGSGGFNFNVTIRASRGRFLLLEADPTAAGITAYTLTVPSGVTATQLYTSTNGVAANGRLTIIWQLTYAGLTDLTGVITLFATGGTVSGATNQRFILELVEANNLDASAGTAGVIQQVTGTAASGATITLTPAAFARANNTMLLLAGGGSGSSALSSLPQGLVTDISEAVGNIEAAFVGHRNNEPAAVVVTAAASTTAAVLLELQGLPAISIPTTTLVTPALGTIAAATPIIIDVTDSGGDLSTAVVTANGVTVHTGAATGAFSAGFTANSTNNAVTNGRRYSILPDSGVWAAGGLTIVSTPTDTPNGSTSTSSFSFTVSLGAAPVITRNAPAIGSIAGTTSIDLSVTDADTDLSTVLVKANGVTVHTGAAAGAFSAGFTANGANTGITNGRQYVFKPDAGVWATGALTVEVTAVDALGNTTTASYTWTVSAPATVAPVVTRVSPALGPITPSQVLTLKATDGDGDLTVFTVNASFPTLGTTETVYNGTSFVGTYTGSTETPLTGPNGKQLGVARTGGWPDAAGVTLSGLALDSIGNLVPFSFTWPSVTFPFVPGEDASDAPSEADTGDIGFDIKVDEATRRWVRTPNGDIARTKGVDAIVQAIRQAVRTFLGEWFLDVTIGIDWFGSILGIKDPDINAIRAQIRAVILSVKGVTNVTAANIELDAASRSFSISYTATGDVSQLIADEFTVDR